MDHRSTVLHLSHSDIRYDFRILRAMDAALAYGHDVRGLGFDSGLGPNVDLGETLQRKISLVRRPNLGAKRSVPSPRPRDTVRRMEVAEKRGGMLNKVSLAIVNFFSVVRELRRFRPEIIHVHDALQIPMALFARIFCGASIVYDAHELNSERTGISWGLGLWTSLWERLSWPFLSGFVTVSDAMRQHYENRYGAKPSIVVRNLYSPTDPNGLSDWNERNAREALAVDDDTVLFAYVGALEEGRMLTEIVQAFSSVDEDLAVLMVLGAGTKFAELNQVPQRGAIKFVDPVPNFALGTFLRGVDFGFCLLNRHNPSEFRALPNKLFEYIAAGVRPICNDFPEMSAVAESSGGLAWSGENLAEDLSSLIAKGRPVRLARHYAERFSWKNEGASIPNLYESIHLASGCRHFKRVPQV